MREMAAALAESNSRAAAASAPQTFPANADAASGSHGRPPWSSEAPTRLRLAAQADGLGGGLTLAAQADAVGGEVASTGLSQARSEGGGEVPTAAAAAASHPPPDVSVARVPAAAEQAASEGARAAVGDMISNVSTRVSAAAGAHDASGSLI